jgi:hypothetical protein
VSNQIAKDPSEARRVIEEIKGLELQYSGKVMPRAVARRIKTLKETTCYVRLLRKGFCVECDSGHPMDEWTKKCEFHATALKPIYSASWVKDAETMRNDNHNGALVEYVSQKEYYDSVEDKTPWTQSNARTKEVWTEKAKEVVKDAIKVVAKNGQTVTMIKH